MINRITIQDQSNEVIWQSDLDIDEFNRVKDMSSISKEVVPIFLDTLRCVRTNSLKGIAEDLFLPTVVHHAIKVESIAFRCIAIVAAFILDIGTLFIRLITFIPFAIYNAFQEEVPLHQYLVEQEVDEDLIRECVKVCFYQQENNRRRESSKFVNFIDLPVYDNYDRVTSSSIGNW